MPPGRLDVANEKITGLISIFQHHEQVFARSDPSPTLSSSLQAIVPSCAQSCLAYYIRRYYNCPGDGEDCLCLEYSSVGYTFGELALFCYSEECNEPISSEQEALYHICSAATGAVQPTHTKTIALPLPSETSSLPTSTSSTGSSSSSISSSSSRTRVSNTSAIPSRTSSISRIATSASQTITTAIVSTDTATPSTSSTALAALPAAASSSLRSTNLSPAAAVGVSVGAMGAVIIAIALIYLILWIQRRRVKQPADDRQSYDFIDDAPPRFSPFHYGQADPRGPLGGFYKQRAELTSDKRKSEWRPGDFPGMALLQDKESKPNPTKMYRGENDSRVLSQLLPDKPEPTPPHLSRKPVPTPATPATVFEEDKISVFDDTSPPAPVPKDKPRHFHPGLPSNPRNFHYPTARKPSQTRRPDKSISQSQTYQRPPLSLTIPNSPLYPIRTPEPAAFPLPPRGEPRRFDEWQRLSGDTRARSHGSDGSLLDYYASPQADRPSTPIENVAQTRRAKPPTIAVTKPVYPPRAVRKDSRGSDTSFESTDPDEPTPPEKEEKEITPVGGSPIAGIRYPKVPRSSNQAVPRSPGLKASPRQLAPVTYLPVKAQHVASYPSVQQTLPAKVVPTNADRPTAPNPVTPENRLVHATLNLSGTTLAAKRRGPDVAHTLSRRLDLDGSASHLHNAHNGGADAPPKLSTMPSATRQDSPLKGYGRGRNSPHSQTHPQQSEVKSPAPPPLQISPSCQGITTSPSRQAGGDGDVWQQDVVLNSPLWKPKLTPGRRGEELFLEVGVATPRRV